MSGTLAELIERLEAMDLSALLTDYTRLQEALNERESVLEALQSFDLSSVTGEERARLKPRLARVIERDQEVSARVEVLQREASHGLSHVITGRAVIRGYGANGDVEASTRRTG